MFSRAHSLKLWGHGGRAGGRAGGQTGGSDEAAHQGEQTDAVLRRGCLSTTFCTDFGAGSLRKAITVAEAMRSGPDTVPCFWQAHNAYSMLPGPVLPFWVGSVLLITGALTATILFNRHLWFKEESELLNGPNVLAHGGRAGPGAAP